jgi:antirestriction protein ArdC
MRQLARARCRKEQPEQFAARFSPNLNRERTDHFFCQATRPRTPHRSRSLSRELAEVLRNDKRAIFTAASKAQHAVAYLQQLASVEVTRASRGKGPLLARTGTGPNSATPAEHRSIGGK